VAQEIADTYSRPWQWGNSWSVETHLVAWFGELGLAALTVSIATAVRRVASDGEMLPRLVASIVAFIVFSVASGLAQWYVATLHMSPETTAGQVALAFRVAMPVAIDLASMLYLSIMNIKSLKRYLAEMGQQAEAIEQVNKSHLRVEQAQQEALQAKQQHDQYMQSLAATRAGGDRFATAHHRPYRHDGDSGADRTACGRDAGRTGTGCGGWRAERSAAGRKGRQQWASSLSALARSCQLVLRPSCQNSGWVPKNACVG
jgi:hypothetical protein